MFINVLAYNHAIELINTGASTWFLPWTGERYK